VRAGKLESWLRSVVALRAPNFAGLPGVPKSLSLRLPSNRRAYNEFIVWIRGLGLDGARSVVDVGANHGDFAMAASTALPGARVVLCEPVPGLVADLHARARATGFAWEVEPIALGAEPGTGVLAFDRAQDAIGSLVGMSDAYRRANPGASRTDSIACRIEPLDEVAKRHALDELDLLKIDVEGFEFEVLDGATRTLPRTRALIVEVSRVRRAEVPGDPLLRMLERIGRAGFEPVDVIPSLWDRDPAWRPLEWNVLARRA
jgi:FkbM family methyltransferase